MPARVCEGQELICCFSDMSTQSCRNSTVLSHAAGVQRYTAQE